MGRTGTSTPHAGMQATRAALLEAGAEVFAERGYRDATLREICRRAGANLAAVKYHFGDKEQFYREVLADAGHRATVPPPGPDGEPEEDLRAMVEGMLHTVLSEGPRASYGRMMAREMVDPTEALDGVVERFIRPQARRMEELVMAVSGGRVRGRDARRCALSVVAQVLFYRHCQPVLRRLYGDGPPGTRQRRDLARHITRFSVDAIRAAARQAPSPSPARA